MTGPRVVSLVPSATETLLAWGVVPVACTRFCEQPELVHVGGTKDPDVSAIVALAPDLVVMDEEENRREDYDSLQAAGLAVLATAIRDLADLNSTLSVLADAVGVAYEPLVLPEPVAHRGRAFVPIWRRPWMALGTPTYGSSILAALGFDNVMAGQSAYPEVTLEALTLLGPDVVLAPDEPYPFAERHLPELSTVGAPVVFVDGKDLFWWGWRTGPAIGRLAVRLASVGSDGQEHAAEHPEKGQASSPGTRAAWNPPIPNAWPPDDAPSVAGG